jgi:hypothetical protein
VSGNTNGWVRPVDGPAERWRSAAIMAVASDLLLAAILAVFLSVATQSTGDAIPRPVVIAFLFATPGVVGLLGLLGRRRSLLLAAALPLIPGSVLSFALVTLVFVIPAVLFLIAAVAMPSRGRPFGGRLVELGRAVVTGGLVIAAGWAVLLGLTVEGCYAIPGGEGCGSGLTSWSGVAAAAALLLAAVGIAAWTVRSDLRTSAATPEA